SPSRRSSDLAWRFPVAFRVARRAQSVYLCRMMIGIPGVLTQAEAAQCRQRLEQATWPHGGRTAGHVAARVKHNQQLADDDPLGPELGALVTERLAGMPRLVAAALPLKILPPRFNRSRDGGHYGLHIDSAILAGPAAGDPER